MTDIQEFPIEYLETLDEVLEVSSFSSKYDVQGAEFVNKKSVMVPRIVLTDGLNDYDGFETENNAQLVYDVYTLDNDKQAVFKVDAVDDIDTAHLLSTQLNAEFLRVKAVPAMDLNFFTAVNAKAAVKGTTALTVDNIKAEIRKIRTAYTQAGLIGGDLYMSSAALELLENAIDRQFAGEGAITDMVGSYNGMNLFEVPDDRLGGLDFAAVAPGVIRYIKKRAVTYLFAPGTHTEGDCWLSQSRWVYGAVAWNNKVKGLYTNKGTVTP